MSAWTSISDRLSAARKTLECERAGGHASYRRQQTATKCNRRELLTSDGRILYASHQKWMRRSMPKIMMKKAITVSAPSTSLLGSWIMRLPSTQNREKSQTNGFSLLSQYRSLVPIQSSNDMLGPAPPALHPLIRQIIEAIVPATFWASPYCLHFA